MTVPAVRPPALPQPSSAIEENLELVLAQSAALWQWCYQNRDLSTARRLRRALDGYAKFVSDRKLRKKVAAEQRLAEALIGSLLGYRPGARTDRTSSSSEEVEDDLNDEQKSEFRKLGKNLSLVRELVAEGVVSRTAILNEIGKAERRAAAAAHAGAGYELLLGDLLEAGESIADESVDVILTDPPYDLEAVKQYDNLAVLAARVLRPGGSMFVMVGQWHLPLAFDMLTYTDSAITYHWTLAYMTPGQAAEAATISRRVNAGWKPVIWFVKGRYEGKVIGDVARSARNEKEHHHWGQSESGIADLMARCSEPGDVVLDPYLGGGTIGYIALAMDRTFIGIDRDPEALAVAAARLAGE